MKIISVKYWTYSKEIFVELYGRNAPTLTITNGEFEFEEDGDYYGPSSYIKYFDIYDLCCLFALWDECYAGE